MAVQFPDPNVTTTYTNPVTGEVYNWNPTSGGWRREQQASGGSLPDPTDPDKQPGTLDDRYVNIIGDTMTGALVQHPGANTAPGGTGNLATNTPSDTQLEFRYQGSDDTVRCVTLPLGCCQTVTKRTEISTTNYSPGWAVDGDVITITDHAEISPSSPIVETYWERNTAVGSPVFERIPGETGQTYTIVDANDEGRAIRAVEVFLKDDECEKEVRSNIIISPGEAPSSPTPRGLIFRWDGGNTLKLNFGRSNPTANVLVYKMDDNGNYQLHETVAFTETSTTYTGSSEYGNYIVEDTGVNFVGFEGSSSDAEIRLYGSSYTDNLTSAGRMFKGLGDFNQDLDWWDTANVTDMSYMFASCGKFNGNITSFNTSNVTNMAYMFYEAHQFDSSDLLNWNTANVTNMAAMFAETKAFMGEGIHWNTGNVTNMAEMFRGSGLNAEMSLYYWDTSKVTNMYGMFEEVGSFNGDIGDWDVSNVTNMAAMFAEAKMFEGDALIYWNTGNVTNMAEMFKGCERLYTEEGLSNWDTSKVTDMYGMFDRTVSFNGGILSREVTVNGNTYIAWDTSNVTNMSHMFIQSDFSGEIGNWDVSNVTNMASMFQSAEFDQDIGNWNTSNVTDMSQMFKDTYSFNRDIGSWDTSNVTRMVSTFFSAWSFNQDIADWQTAKVNDMTSMFFDTRSFEQDISPWCVPLIGTKPLNFDDGSSAQFLNRPSVQPQWGTCPPKILQNPVIQ